MSTAEANAVVLAEPSLSYLAYGARRCVALTKMGNDCRRMTRIEIDGFGPVCCTHLERVADGSTGKRATA